MSSPGIYKWNQNQPGCDELGHIALGTEVDHILLWKRGSRHLMVGRKGRREYATLRVLDRKQQNHPWLM